MRKCFIFNLFLLGKILLGCTQTESDGDSFPLDQSEERGMSPYCSAVLDYYYAPGQHAYIAQYPDFIQGDSSKRSILLGGWGGYVVLAFDHDIENEEGDDIIIYSGSSVQPEPGVVYFMSDKNQNGLADEVWYEVMGSEFHLSNHRYQLTYYAPKSSDANVLWRDNEGRTGELLNSSTWWWNSKDDSITFCGTLLPEAYYNDGTAENEYWKIFPDLFRYGYAENGNRGKGVAAAEDYSVELKGNCFDISDVVDEFGNAVELKSVRFIKVQSGVFQIAGWLGEISTEINGAGDLHLLK